MASKTKVLDIIDRIHLVCILDNTGKFSVYRLYLVYNARHETYGYYTERRKQLAKYGDMASVLCHVKDMFVYGIQYKSVPDIISWSDKYYNS